MTALAWILYAVNNDMRLMLFGSDSHYPWHAQYENITFGMDWEASPLRRTCRDATPAGTLLLPFRGWMPPGCSSMLSEARTVFAMCMCSILPVALKMSRFYAGIVGASILLIYLAACVASGYVNTTMFWALVLLATSSMITCGLCAREEESSKSRFAATMSIRFT